MNVTVYLGANYGTDPALQTTVAELGQWIGKSGHTLVYGGSKTGLMGLLAQSALDQGGSVIGRGAGVLHGAGAAIRRSDPNSSSPEAWRSARPK